MKIAITGSSGFLGSRLVPSLTAAGHEVIRLVRRAPAVPESGPPEVRWQPVLDPEALEGLDAVINLAGAGIGDRRWTAARRREIRDSRVAGTGRLAGALATLARPPRVFLSGSAIGYYGDRGDTELDEAAASGDGFLAGVVRDWEAATEPAREAGIRVVRLRTGHVLDRGGGLLGRMLPIFKAGLGAPLGSGRQYVSWVSLPDWIGAVTFLLDAEISGPVNLTAPEPVTNAELTKALGRALRRPTMPIGVPAFALRLALGGVADDIVTGQRVTPGSLAAAGYEFAHPALRQALAAVV